MTGTDGIYGRAGPISAPTELLLDSAPDGVVIIDETGAIRLVNRQAEVMFGYRREELLGRPIEVLVPTRVRGAHPHHRDAYFRSPEVRPMGADLELAGLRKDGSEFPVDISLSAIETADGVLVLAAVRDITDRLRIEGERARLEAELYEAKRDEERAHLEAQLHQAQRLETVGQLAGGIAHDFNNLLGGIMNYAELVADTLEEEMPRRGLTEVPAFVTLVDDVEEISKVAKRAAALTHQLLVFSRREVVQPEVLDLNAIVSDLENLLRRTIGENVDLRTSLEPDLPRIKADRGQLEQVFMNLAVNARDAMPSGGRLDIATSSFEADEQYARTHPVGLGRYIRLTVSDSGVGMSAEVAARAFEPFFTTKGTGQGTGLGLATVYGIVTRAGGDVVIYSEPGMGTTIRVNLLVTDEPDSARRREAEAAPAVGRGETVLLVEDEETVRESARRMLVRAGYVVLAAGNADEAMALVARHEGAIDLLLTDVVMPGRSGRELADEVGRSHPDIAVLFMSGYTQDVIVHQGVLQEGVRLIEKPFASQDLLRHVRDTLDGV